MSKLSKHVQMYRLIDSFIDAYPETQLAIEWRELTANGLVKAFMLALPVPKYEKELPERAQISLSIIKPLLGLG